MAEKTFDVVALGELLIDFTENGLSCQNNPLFEANPGGAPCNVLAMLRKLGRSCAFAGKVGDDMFGQQLRAVVEEAGICGDYLVTDRNARTTLAFVKKLPNGDRDFSFFRNPGADMMLTEAEVPGKVIGRSRVFHFGTLSMTHEGVRRATRHAVGCARMGGALVSFDPNLRPPLWESLEEARDELEFMTGETDLDKGAAALRRQYPNIRLFNVTAGPEGSGSYYEDKRVFVPACKLGGTIETTGAGDTFCACVLNFVLEHGLDGLAEEDLTAMLRFANTAAYLVTTRKGAIRSMPEREQVEALL